VTRPQPRLIGLSELDPQERAACSLVVQVLDVVQAEAWDVDGRQGAVDVMLTLGDGRMAAFEVTNLGEEDALDLARLLGKIKYKWPVVGDWFWRIEVGSVADLDRLKLCFDEIIRICEAAGEPDPRRIEGGWPTHPSLRWLVRESSSEMTGFPKILAKNLKRPMTEVVPRVGAGFADESLSGFAAGLAKAFEKPHIQKHFDKLARTGADERHLFIPLHDSALPFSVSSELIFKETLPPDPPVVPDSVTHLWLAPAGSPRVLLWTRAEGWRNYSAKLRS
jgi:hypothetical protein